MNDIVKPEKLKNMNIHHRIIEIAKHVPVIEKDSTLAMGKSKVAVNTYDYVISTLQPYLNAYEIVCLCNDIPFHEFNIREVKTKNGTRDAFNYDAIFRFKIYAANIPTETVEVVVPATAEAFDSKVATYAHTQAYRQVWQKILRTMSGENEEAATSATENVQHQAEIKEILDAVKKAEDIDELTALFDTMAGFCSDHEMAIYTPHFSARRKKLQTINDDDEGTAPEPEKERKIERSRSGRNNNSDKVQDINSARKKEPEKEESEPADTEENILDEAQFQGDVADQILDWLEEFGVENEDAAIAFKIFQEEQIEHAWDFNETKSESIEDVCVWIVKHVRGNDKLSKCSILDDMTRNAIDAAGWRLKDVVEELSVKSFGAVLIKDHTEIMKMIRNDLPKGYFDK